MVLNCFVSAANTADVKGAKVVLAPVLEAMVRIEKILADQAYKGELSEALEKAHNCVLEVTEKLGTGFIVTMALGGRTNLFLAVKSSTFMSRL